MPVHAASQFTRHEVLVRAWHSLAGLALFSLAGLPHEASAEKLQKEEVAYQDRPKAGRSCATCRQFSPTAAGTGTCAVIEGEVSANGWCTAYSPSGSAMSHGSSAKTAAVTVPQRTNRVRSVAVTNTASTEEGAHT